MPRYKVSKPYHIKGTRIYEYEVIANSPEEACEILHDRDSDAPDIKFIDTYDNIYDEDTDYESRHGEDLRYHTELIEENNE